MPPSAASVTWPTALPHSPGVYLFRDDRSRVLYVGTSRDLRKRVRSYFTASETRSRMGEMVRLAATVTGIECATPLEAEVRELRLIAEHKPSYNRRSRFPEKVTFVKLTREPWPRLSLVKQVLDDDADYLGPFSLSQGRREVPGRDPRHVPGPAVLRPVRQATVAVALRAGGDGPVPLAVRRQRRRRTPTPPSYASCARRCCAVPTTSSTRSTRGWRRWPTTSASRRPVSTATGWRPSSGPRRAPSG